MKKSKNKLNQQSNENIINALNRSKNVQNESVKLFFIIAFAFIFSVLARLYWVAWASGYEPFFWNNELMISTNDGYAFAEGARDILAGFHQPNDLSYVDYPLAKLTAWIVRLFGVSIESAMLYMSVFFSSLVVVGVALIANEYKSYKVGFVAALLATVANSYYNRTMAGYYDTDMLIIPLSVFVLWGLVRMCERKRVSDILIAPFFTLIYMWWYASAFSLLSVTIVLFLLYTIIFERKELLFYAQIALMILAITNLNFYLKFGLILVIYIAILYQKERLGFKFIFAILVLVFAIFTICGGLNPIIFQLKFYVFRSVAESSDLAFHYFNVNQTIQESGIVDLVLFCERISGHVVTFALSLFGVVLFCFHHRSFIITLGMVALGFLALKSGLRFTIYAVPIMALGFGYFAVWILNLFKLNGAIFIVGYAMMILCALLPVASHIYHYKASPVFMRSEVEILDKFKDLAKREDYALAWWDYGYPIRYYSDVKTLIDGGKHLGKDNFAVSFALGADQISSANMARLEVEYTERNFKERFGANLNKMMSETNSTDVNAFLHSLGDIGFTPPPKTREIYYYLPERMLNIFPTILQFSRLDLNTGKERDDGLFFISSARLQDDKGVSLSNGFIISNDLSTLSYNGTQMSLNSFFETETDAKGNLNVREYKNDESSKFYGVFMRDSGRFLIMDESIFYSVYIQLFVLERYDERLFEPVVLDSVAKIYKLKR
nr:STT3 domain-containing protein [Campylobacter anatolicus]